jgi:hypothetical protein
MGRGRSTRTLAAALAAAALLAAPAQADAALRWGDSRTLMKGGFPGSVHIDARGDVLAIWHRNLGGGTVRDIRTYYAWRAPRGAWTTPREVEASRQAIDFAVTLSPRGHATAAWHDGHGRIVAVEAQAGGSFDKPDVVASGVSEGRSVRLAADDAGNALVAWSDDVDPAATSGIAVSTRRAGGAWSKPEELHGGGAGSPAAVAINPAGAAAVAWMTSVGGHPQVAYRQPAGSFGPAEQPPIEGPVYPFKIALDDAGRVHLAAPSKFMQTPVRTRLTSRSALGGWSDMHEFDTGGAPQVLLVDPDGNVNLFMDNYDVREQPMVQHVVRRPDGTVVGPNTLALGRYNVDAAMNLRGDMMAAWDYPPQGAPGPVEAAVKPAGQAAFGPGVPISKPNSVAPVVALNDAGQAAVMWAIGGYANPSLQVAVRDDPSLPILPFPPAIDIDLPELPEIDADGDLPIDVLCAVSCKASARGVLAPGGGAQLRAGSGKTRKLRAKRRGALTLDFGSDGADAVRAAGGRATVFVTVRARGKSPRPITVSRRVRLR